MKIKAILGSLMMLIVLGSCKYEESGLSLRTKKSRVTNSWYKDAIELENGKVEKIGKSDSDTWEFTKDGDFFVYDVSSTDVFSYKWEFANSKKELKITDPVDGETFNFEILKLKKDEMWLKDIEFKDVLRLKPS
ncbi:MAG: hypothetical protein ACPGVD_05690 [Flavobacteriales bacterium]